MDQEFRYGLAGQFWLRVSYEAVVSDGLTGAGGSAFKVAHSQVWSVVAGY